MRGPREGLRENPALGRGGREKGATPWPMAGPRGQDCQAAPPPPWPTGGIARGPKAPPQPPPPPPTQARERAGGRPPHPPPPPHPPQLGSHRRGPPPPQGRGGAPTLRRNGDAVRATAAGPAPANPHQRVGATRTMEHEGGRAPHDPPVTTAHSEVTEGGFSGQLGPPGERATGRPSPPPTPGRHFSPDRTRAPEGSAPATRREPERSTAGRRPEREQGGRGATSPPPPPHQPASRGGPGPHPPRQGGWAPPTREGSRSLTRPPAPDAGSHGGREEQAGPRLRTGTPHRSYPEKPGEHEPEWYGGPRPPWTAQRQ